MRELLIYDQELDDVAIFNALATGFFSAASACLFFVFGIVVDALMQETLSEKAIGLLQFGVPAGLVLVIGFGVAGIWASKTRGSRVAAMKKQAMDIDQTADIKSELSPEPAIQPLTQGTEASPQSGAPA